MKNDVQILFRAPRRLANQFDQAAQTAGVSRNQWLLSALTQSLHHREANILGLTTLQSTLTTQMMLEAWLSSRVEPSAIQQIRQTAKKMAGKYYDA